jgi:hypothetical protein
MVDGRLAMAPAAGCGKGSRAFEHVRLWARLAKIGLGGKTSEKGLRCFQVPLLD